MSDIEEMEQWLRTRSGVLELLARLPNHGPYVATVLTPMVVTGSLDPVGDMLALRYGLQTLIRDSKKATIAWLRLALHLLECPVCPEECETRERLERDFAPLAMSIAKEIGELMQEAHDLDEAAGEE